MGTENKISETAFAVMSLRALSTYENYELMRVQDNHAELFLPDDKKEILSNINSRNELKKTLPKGLYEYVIVRTKYFDKVFSDALKNNINQIVIIGAGFDSRAYRFEKMTLNTRIFELDTKPTQDYKLECLRKHNIDTHQQVTFIPINFETDDPFTKLNQYGFNRTLYTLFIWEGVTFYLSHDTVTCMLQKIRKNSGKGSRVCFDFQTIQSNNDFIDTGLKDEVIKFGIESGEIENFVNDQRYRIQEHISAEEMERRYLIMQNSMLFGRIMPMMHFLLIEHE